MNTPLILASASPRRCELLAQLGVEFEVLPVGIDESCLPGENSTDCVKRLSLEKARAVSAKKPAAVVIGADTLISASGQVFGKPTGREDALRMLECLSGRSHEVLTGVAIVGQNREESVVQSSTVYFGEISPREAQAYWETEEPIGKAGGYAIQGIAGQFVKRLEGSYSGVMGLPLHETALLLKQFGIMILESDDA